MYSRPWYSAIYIFRGVEVWRISFYLYFFLVNIGFGMYLTITRDMVRGILGYDYSFMTLIVASENIPLIISVLSGGLGDVFGRRLMVLTGAFSAIPLLLMGYLPLEYIPILAAAYIFFWSLAQPSITGALLHATSSSGIQYSIYALFGTIGWGLGGPLAGILIGSYGWRIAWFTTALIDASSFLIAYVFFPVEYSGGGVEFRELVSATRIVLPFFLSGILCVSGFLLFFGTYSLILRGRIRDPGLYGVVYTFIPAIVGITTRPLVGLLSERIEPWKIALMGVAMYMVIVYGLYSSTGLLMIILWAIPVYPFIDQGYLLSISRSLPGRLQAFASGVWSTVFSVGGLSVLAVSLTGSSLSLYTVLLLSEFFFASSLVVLSSAVLRRRSTSSLSM